jgi:hypothetical protein
MSRFAVRTLCTTDLCGFRQLETDRLGARRPTNERPGLLPGAMVAA